MGDGSVSCRFESSSDDGRVVVEVTGRFDREVSQAELLRLAIDGLVDVAGGRWRPGEDEVEELLTLLRDAWIGCSSWVTGFDVDVLAEVLAGEVRSAVARLESSEDV